MSNGATALKGITTKETYIKHIDAGIVSYNK